MRQCKSSGIDCKVHGLSIIGHLKSEDEDLAANFRYLASDNEDQERPLTSSNNKKLKPITSKDIKTHVFVWGLNDKDQLGGPKGSKVSFSRILLSSQMCLCFFQIFSHSFHLNYGIRLLLLPSSEFEVNVDNNGPCWCHVSNQIFFF